MSKQIKNELKTLTTIIAGNYEYIAVVARKLET